MFIVNEPQDTKPSGMRHKIMLTIDNMVPEFHKEFTLSISTKKVVKCDFQDDNGEIIISFIARGNSYTDALKHIKRQVGYYNKFNENYYAGGENYRCPQN